MRATISTSLFKLILGWSAFVLLLFGGKVALWLEITQLADLTHLRALGVWLRAMAAPQELPLWQLAGALNALLAWVFYLLIDGAVKDHANGLPVSADGAARQWAIFQAVRTTLSLYTIACTFYITAHAAWAIDWPPLRFVLFPWAG